MNFRYFFLDFFNSFFQSKKTWRRALNLWEQQASALCAASCAVYSTARTEEEQPAETETQLCENQEKYTEVWPVT